MDAGDTKTSINGLSAGGGTNFEAPLQQALQFFGGLSGGAANIVYFLSDGMGSGSYNDEATELQKIADVRAFGIGGANLSTLNIIDSGDAVLLSDPTQLQTEFQKSGFSKDDITEIKIFLDIDPNDTIAPIQVDTISPDQLQDSTLGLSVTGKISGLNTSVNAQNKISAEVVFNDGTPNTIVDFTINTDQGKGSPTDQNDRLSFAPTQKEIDAGAGDDEIVANDLANTIYAGDGNDIVFAAGGNDTIYPGLGDNRIDGGDGIDTVVYTETLAQRGPVNKVGGLIKVGTGTDTLSNVEFIQFADTRISTQTLLPVPILSGQNISVVEGNSGQLTTIDFAVSLSSVAQENVTFSYQTFDGSATTGVDYNQVLGQIIVPVGSSDAIITVEIIGDNQFEFDEDFGIVLSQLSGASFDDNGNELTLFAAIENDDNAQPTDIFLTNETIPENLPVETVLGQFFTTDPDGDTQFSYTLVNGEGDTDNGIFVINNNELSSNQPFDFETKNSYSIRVQTNDGNGGTFEKQFTINVSDVDEETDVNTTPLLQTPLGDQIVLQNQPFSFTIPTNTFNDPDGDTLTYALGSIGPGLPNGITFDPNTGTFSGTTDELGAKLIEVIASDPGNANVSDSFQLRVLKNVEVPDTEGSLQVDGDALDNYLDASTNNGKYRLDGGEGNDIIVGSNQRDVLIGGDGDDELFGNDGVDQLYGGAGDDLLDGGTGMDFLYGGPGADRFVLRAGDGPDRLMDFNAPEGDRLLLVDGLSFGALSFDGNKISLGTELMATVIDHTGTPVTDFATNPQWFALI